MKMIAAAHITLLALAIGSYSSGTIPAAAAGGFDLTSPATAAAPSTPEKRRKPNPGGLAAVHGTGGLAYQRNVKKVEHLGGGAYEVTFKKSVKGCFLFAQAGNPNPSGGGSTTVIATPFFSPSSKKLVRVYLWDTVAGAAVDGGFYLQVVC